MVAAFKQILTVQQDGRLEIRAAELRAGSQAEVIVLVERQAPPGMRPLDALTALQQSLRLDAHSASEWTRQVRDERSASGPQD